jgi:hypothetical protein
MQEKIVGILPNASSGLFGQKSYNLIITTTRLIAAITTNKMLKEAVQQTRQQSKQQADGILKQVSKTVMSTMGYHQKYYDMSIEEILLENPENFFIDKDMIKKIKVLSGTYIPEQAITNPHTLKIKTTTAKHKFLFKTMQPKEVKKLLVIPFGPIIK